MPEDTSSKDSCILSLLPFTTFIPLHSPSPSHAKKLRILQLFVQTFSSLAFSISMVSPVMQETPLSVTNPSLLGDAGELEIPDPEKGDTSKFLNALKVIVSTKSPKSDKQYIWEAAADSSSYVIREETDPEKQLHRGT
ncbi:hypothetical protein L6452_02475 [Arctium lappa]|uniref:Uncharacterized protein n=1 Tax=Arctium lappa TaxID=4217 RepID=A0ACB9FK55_ARCLA|nr:hypothetical protein L6452_02475 [Arctium lappa]